MGDMALSSLSRTAAYWPFSWRALSALVLGVLLAKWIWILFAPQATFTSAVPERAAGIETGSCLVCSSNRYSQPGRCAAECAVAGCIYRQPRQTRFCSLKAG